MTLDDSDLAAISAGATRDALVDTIDGATLAILLGDPVVEELLDMARRMVP